MSWRLGSEVQGFTAFILLTSQWFLACDLVGRWKSGQKRRTQPLFSETHSYLEFWLSPHPQFRASLTPLQQGILALHLSFKQRHQCSCTASAVVRALCCCAVSDIDFISESVLYGKSNGTIEHEQRDVHALCLCCSCCPTSTESLLSHSPRSSARCKLFHLWLCNWQCWQPCGVMLSFKPGLVWMQKKGNGVL